MKVLTARNVLITYNLFLFNSNVSAYLFIICTAKERKLLIYTEKNHEY